MVEENHACSASGPAVSVWPTVSPLSANYVPMRDSRGLLAETDDGVAMIGRWPDGSTAAEAGVAFDAAGERDFLWDKVETSYYKLGIEGHLGSTRANRRSARARST